MNLFGYLKTKIHIRRNFRVFCKDVSENELRIGGMDKYGELFKATSSFIVGDGGINVEEFMIMDLMRPFCSFNSKTEAAFCPAKSLDGQFLYPK